MAAKLSEEEVKKRIAAAQERRKKIIDLRLAVLEGNLVVEEALNGFLEAALFNPEHLNIPRINFSNKGNFAISLAAARGKDEMWDVLWAINQLRNELAHNIDSKKIDEKVAFLRKTYVAALEPKPAEYAKTLSDKDLVDQACSVCAGFLGQLTSEAKMRRGIVDQHWKGP
ncbi:hypothetical protein ACQR16_10130 [Bradyrhizobium oligotrophicum]|uniref:hypothetical protein n=1 Tax=Bradyrhizobium oligotrophicum TaxID=44255 RepID=UPI003EB86F9B